LHRRKDFRSGGAAGCACAAAAVARGRRLTMKARVFLLLTALMYAGCAVGPNYHRPQIETPSSFRAPRPLPAQETVSVADVKWFEVFNDPQLQDLVRTALAQNYDLRDAVARVEQARANLGITRSNQQPNFGVGTSLGINRLSRDGATPIPDQLLPSQN